MKISPSTKGFYAAECRPENVPEDAIEITEELHAQLLAGEAAGKMIDFDESGNPVLVEPPPPPPPVYICTPWQIRKALNSAGLRQQIETAVAGSPDQNLKDGWEFATEFRSDDAFVIAMGSALGKTNEETSALIQLAATL